MPRIRLIPATIVTAVALLGVKLTDVVRGTEALSNTMLISTVEAQQPSPAPSQAKLPVEGEAKKEAEPKAEEKKEGGAEEKKGEGKGEEKKNPAVSDTPGETIGRHYTAVELELLQNLGRRRDELNHWEENIQIKESALDATEKRIDEKISQIDAMKKEVTELLAEYNEKEDAKIKSLVKIYESMKPKDAARIFDEVEMPILLMVIDKMSEKKAAPILAEMNPLKAKQVTVQLAEERRVQSAKLTAPAKTP